MAASMNSFLSLAFLMNLAKNASILAIFFSLAFSTPSAKVVLFLCAFLAKFLAVFGFAPLLSFGADFAFIVLFEFALFEAFLMTAWAFLLPSILSILLSLSVGILLPFYEFIAFCYLFLEFKGIFTALASSVKKSSNSAFALVSLYSVIPSPSLTALL